MKSSELKRRQTEAAECWYKDKSKENMDKLFVEMKPYLKYVAKLYYKPDVNNGLTFDDVYQAAALGIMRCLQNYNGSGNFTSYVRSYVLKETYQQHTNHFSILKFGDNPNRDRLLLHYSKIKQEIEQNHIGIGVDDLDKEIAEIIGCELRHIVDFKNEIAPVTTFDHASSSLDDAEDFNLHDLIADTGSKNPEYEFSLKFDSNAIKTKIEEKFAHKKPLSLAVLFDRILGDDKDNQVTSDRTGVSRERIRQVKKEMEGELKRFVSSEIGCYF